MQLQTEVLQYSTELHSTNRVYFSVFLVMWGNLINQLQLPRKAYYFINLIVQRLMQGHNSSFDTGFYKNRLMDGWMSPLLYFFL